MVNKTNLIISNWQRCFRKDLKIFNINDEKGVINYVYKTYLSILKQIMKK